MLYSTLYGTYIYIHIMTRASTDMHFGAWSTVAVVLPTRPGSPPLKAKGALKTHKPQNGTRTQARLTLTAQQCT
jgi:hypothetical protein